MCYLVSDDKMQTYYKDNESSIGHRSITDNTIPKALEEFGATINFIDVWLKCFLKNMKLDVYHI